MVATTMIARRLPPWAVNTIYTLYNADPRTGLCNRGRYDPLLVAFFVVVILSVRIVFYTGLMPRLLHGVKLAAGVRGVRKFAEQAWMFMCHSISLTTGLCLIRGTVYERALLGKSEGTRHLWIGYPLQHRDITIGFKTYYLVALAYWLHFICALSYEYYQQKSCEWRISRGEKNVIVPYVRKDFWPLVGHHIVTVLLVALSHYMNFIRIGHVVMILLDVSDICICFAKMMNYIPSTPDSARALLFTLFASSWIYTRHYVLVRVCWSIYAESLVNVDKEFLVWDPNGVQSFYSMKVYWFFLGLFAALQVLLVYWLFMILRIAVLIVTGHGIVDDRSDNEKDEVEVVAPPKAKKTLKTPAEHAARRTGDDNSSLRQRKSSPQRKSSTSPRRSTVKN